MPPKLFAQAPRWLAGLLTPRSAGRPPALGEQPPAHAWYSPSSLVLIAANLVPLYGVLALDWPVFPIMVLFWLENIVIGLLNVLRMLLADPTNRALWHAKLGQVPFFGLHYGLFAAIHGLLVFRFFGSPVYEGLIHELWTGAAVLRVIADYDLGLSLAVLATSHAFSFLWNYVGRGEFRQATLKGLVRQPYSRVVVLHVTLLVGGGVVLLLGSPLWALVVLIALKIALDLRAHLRDHGQPAPAARSEPQARG